jgi:hypothetical protein
MTVFSKILCRVTSSRSAWLLWISQCSLRQTSSRMRSTLSRCGPVRSAIGALPDDPLQGRFEESLEKPC